MGRVILASTSPRRRELLKNLCDWFKVVAPDAEELETGDPYDVVIYNAVKKGRSVTEDCDLLISCDTVVAFNGVIYGKPMTKERAKRMLRELSSNTHKVVSGVYLRYGGQEFAYTETSEVTFRDLSDEDIEEYVSKSNPLDKAGAYGIQDGAVVAGYKGDYNNIVGLPTARLAQVIRELRV